MSIQAKFKDEARRASGSPPVARRVARAGELRILSVACEQGVMTVGQLQRMLRIGNVAARRRVEALVALGWAGSGEFAGHEGVWFWPLSRGYELVGLSPRFKPVSTRQLSHSYAITEARLSLAREYPEAEWVCERELWRAPGRKGVVPDGLLKVGGRQIAVEVEMTRKPRAVLREVVGLRSAVYDEVIYLATPVVRGLVESVVDDLGVGNVRVRGIPAPRKGFGGEAFDRQAFEPDAEELTALALICEEGLVAAAQLGLLLGTGREAGMALGRRLEERNFVRREFEVGGDGGWLRCLPRAGVLAGVDLHPFFPRSPAGLETRETLAAVRAAWCRRPGRRGWVTRRRLVAGLPGPRRSDVPAAVAESEAGSVAVVLVDRHVSIARRRRDLGSFSERFDGVLCVADQYTSDWVRRHVDEMGLVNVELFAWGEE